MYLSFPCQERRQELEDKYNLEKILAGTHEIFLFQPGYEDAQIHEFKVYIHIKGTQNDWYIIQADQSGPARLWKESTTDIKRDILEGGLIEDSLILSQNRTALEEVCIKFRGKIIKRYSGYDEFWEDIHG